MRSIELAGAVWSGVYDVKGNKRQLIILLSNLSAVEKVIDQRGAFCFGDQPTMADVFLIPAVHIAKVTGVAVNANQNTDVGTLALQ